jgi:hypothetical protein
MMPTFFNPFAIFFTRLTIAYPYIANPSDAFTMAMSSIVTLSHFMLFKKNQVTFFDTDATKNCQIAL